MPRKRTRDGSKTERYMVRMSKEDMQKLETASQVLGKTKSDIVREGIEVKWQLTRYKV